MGVGLGDPLGSFGGPCWSIWVRLGRLGCHFSSFEGNYRSLGGLSGFIFGALGVVLGVLRVVWGALASHLG